jgi:hypothetical protein
VQLLARGGAPAARVRLIVRTAAGIIICPRIEDLASRTDYVPAGDESQVPCSVCSHAVSMVPSTFSLQEQGWAPVCTYDAERFRHVMTWQATTPDLELDRRLGVERFARAHGGRPEDVVQTLPPELEWLTQRLAP